MDNRLHFQGQSITTPNGFGLLPTGAGGGAAGTTTGLNMASPIQQGRPQQSQQQHVGGGAAPTGLPSNAQPQQRAGTGMNLPSGAMQQMGLQSGTPNARMGLGLGQQFAGGIPGIRTGVQGGVNLPSSPLQQQPVIGRTAGSPLHGVGSYGTHSAAAAQNLPQQQQRGFGGLSGMASGRGGAGGINTGLYGAPSGDLLTMLNKGVRQPDDAPAFNASDFPSLSSASGDQQRNSSQDGQNDSFAALLSNQKSPRQTTALPSFGEEDFPALPGASAQTPPRKDGEFSSHFINPATAMQQSETTGGVIAPPGISMTNKTAVTADASLRLPQNQILQQQKVPSSVNIKSPLGKSLEGQRPSRDRFGLAGLLEVVQPKDPDLLTLTAGIDLTTLGLNLNTRDLLWKTFGSPWADGPGKIEPNFKPPPCYLNAPPPLQPKHFSQFEPDTLFYIFYGMPGDEAQLFAADELASRGWYFHKELKTWLTRAPNTEPLQKTERFEKGTFFVFDPTIWDVLKKENFTVNFDVLERPPGIAKAAASGKPM